MEESKQSSISIWTTNWIFNTWNNLQLSGNDRWGLYWQCTYFTDIHRLFKVPYNELMNILYVLSKELNLTYKDMNDMPFFEILTILDVYKTNMEEQRKHQEQENDQMEQRMNDMQSRYNMNDFAKNMPKYDTPSFNFPKI